MECEWKLNPTRYCEKPEKCLKCEWCLDFELKWKEILSQFVVTSKNGLEADGNPTRFCEKPEKCEKCECGLSLRGFFTLSKVNFVSRWILSTNKITISLNKNSRNHNETSKSEIIPFWALLLPSNGWELSD